MMTIDVVEHFIGQDRVSHFQEYAKDSAHKMRIYEGMLCGIASFYTKEVVREYMEEFELKQPCAF